MLISVFLFFIGFALKMFKDIKTQTVTNPYTKCGIYMLICLAFGCLYGFETQSLDNTISWFSAFFLELVLSFDNLAVILMVMASANLKDSQQKTVLNYGIFGAVIMRILMLTFGVGLVSNFAMILFPLFGLYLAFMGYSLLDEHAFKQKVDKLLNYLESKNLGWVGKALEMFLDKEALSTSVASKIIPILSKHKVVASLIPLSLLPTILQVEVTDLLFAVDSIPAVLALTTSWPIVVTSNLAAISFLREMYFVFHDLQSKLYYLTTGVAYAILVIALKLLLHPVLHAFHVEVPVLVSFTAVLLPIVISVALSIKNPQKGD